MKSVWLLQPPGRIAAMPLVCLVCLMLTLTAEPREAVAADEGTVTYSFFPTAYTPGSPVQVKLTANQYSWGTHVRIEDRFPTGWTVSGANPPASQVGNKLVWDLPLVGKTALTVRYDATAPAGASGVAAFHHLVVFSSDSTSQQTDGDRLIAAAGGGCSLGCSATGSTAAGTAPLAVAFAGSASPSGCSGSVAYDWSFGDGSPHDSAQSPSHTYTSPGVYTWTMTASIGGVTCTRTGTVTVSSGCSLACSASVPSTASAGSAVTFQGSVTPTNCSGSPAFDWSFGDGSAHDARQNPSHTYSTAGAYSWTLTTSIGGVSCSRTGTITVTQTCALTCSASAPLLAAVGSAVTFRGTATATGCSGSPTWEWDWGDGSAHGTGATPAHTYAAVGSYHWRGAAAVGTVGCSASGDLEVSQAPAIGQAGSQRFLVDTSGHTPGAAGSTWVTDLVIHNPGTEPATANLYFLKQGQENSTAVGRTVEVQAGASLRLADVVATAFGESSTSGAVLVGSPASLIVASRTFSTATTGTYGQYVEGYPASRLVAGTAAVRLLQLTRSTSYRTNIGFANATAADLPVVADLYRADGSKIATRSHTVKPFGYLQDNDVFNAAGAPSVEDGYAVVHSTSAGASYLTYASVIDNRTNDPVHVVPVRSSAETGTAADVLLAEPTWVAVNSGLTTLDVRAVACDPAHAGTMYAGTYGGGVFKSTNGGTTWSPANQGLSTTIVQALCVDPVNPSNVYAGTWDSGVFRSSDSGATWGQAASGLTSSDVLHLVCDPFASGTVLAGTNGKDVFKTSNGGTTWVQVPTSMPFAEIEALAADSLTQGTFYAGGWYIYKTTSSGSSWTKIYDNPSVTALVVDPTSAQRIYGGRYSEVVKSTNGGSSWAASPVSASPVRALAIDPLNPNNVYAGGGYASGVFRSTNGGASWTAMNTGLGDKNVTRLAFDPWTRSTLYAATAGGVFKVSFGIGCTFTLDPTSQSLPSSGGTGSFTVNASNPACSWTASTPDSWITITGGASGTGTGTVSYSVGSTAPIRTGTITAAGQTFTVNQMGNCPCYAPPAPVLSAPASAASGASYTLSWTAAHTDNAYQLQESKDPSFAGAVIVEVTGTSKTTTHTETSGSATWYARVRTKRTTCGLCPVTSEWSNVTQTVVASTCQTPSAPELFAPVNAPLGTYTLSWTATSPDNLYQVQESTDPAFAGAATTEVTGTSTLTSHPAGEPGQTTTWHARVRAKEACGSSFVFSSWSNVRDTLVGSPCGTPAAPVLTAPATATSGATYTLSWTATSAENKYELQQSTDPAFAGAVIETVNAASTTTSHVVTASTTWCARVRAVFSCQGTTYRSNWSATAQTVVSGAAPTGQAIYLPAAAHVAGTGGTNWRSDVEIHNPGSTQARFTLALLKNDQDNGSPPGAAFTLDGGKAVRYGDVLAAPAVGFAFSGSGTLRVTPSAGEVMATMRTFNDQATGTFGQFIPGQPQGGAIVQGQQARLIMLVQSVSTTTGFRSNLGVVNAVGSTMVVKVDLYRGDGTLLGTQTVSLRPFEHKQIDKVLTLVTSAEVAEGYAVLQTTTQTGAFFAYASVIDNRSGDPIYIPARRVE